MADGSAERVAYGAENAAMRAIDASQHLFVLAWQAPARSCECCMVLPCLL